MAMTLESLFSLRGKVALVTGGSRGIGEMIAAGLVAAGARVTIAARKKAECDEALQRLGPNVDAISADLSSQAGTRALADAMAAREPKLHILVNNAGANWGAPLREFPESGWDKVMSLNVKAVFDLTRFLLPQLEAAATPGDPARVINVGSIDGIQVPPLETYAYSASKAAVHHMSAVLAKKLGPTVTVNAIAPGPFESKMMHETLQRFGEGIKKTAPMRRIGEPEDMAGGGG
jgi:NAD(P)-dependent dehydrogenase (short-subunit alcohol dehydrogenase family)